MTTFEITTFREGFLGLWPGLQWLITNGYGCTCNVDVFLDEVVNWLNDNSLNWIATAEYPSHSQSILITFSFPDDTDAVLFRMQFPDFPLYDA